MWFSIHWKPISGRSQPFLYLFVFVFLTLPSGSESLRVFEDSRKAPASQRFSGLSDLFRKMVRKGAETAEFVYGLGISSLEPPEHLEDEDDMPLRFVSVQLQLPDTSKNFDIGKNSFPIFSPESLAASLSPLHELAS